eukprot:GDKJ01015683.1.p1 GENE.GDKJ01015683.1~~GDKJ01015683.1.p1  ORF type:complete len:302 (-),score=53.71 GDKJ01015683.1:311-1216(-)
MGEMPIESITVALPPVVGAALVVSAAMYPADVVRAICMANPGTGAVSALKGFLKVHGLKGFLNQGLGAEITRATFSRSVKFWMQPIAHQLIFEKNEKLGSPLTKGIAGALATIPEVIVISPFENIKLAQQLDREGRFLNAASVVSHLHKTCGFRGLYIGYTGMQLRQMLWTGGYFSSLDFMRQTLNFGPNHKLATDITSGFCAGVVGVILNCWTDVVRSVVQKETIRSTFNLSSSPNTKPAYITFSSVFNRLVAQNGFKALYSGFLPKCLHLGGSGALLAVLMPRFKEIWVRRLAVEKQEF